MRRFQPDPSRYEIERNVGEGVSASVFKAIRIDGQQRSRQSVALKFLKDRTAVDFLRREFETLSKVVSPNCGRVLSWESSGEDCALVLEWIDGPTLFDLATRIPLTTAVIDVIVAQIYQGLRDLRDVGLHHGDLHPKNIMIDRSGRVKLVDFASGALGAGFIHGAPQFLAPEIWSGCSTSFNTDLFALGVIESGLKNGFSGLPEKAESQDVGLRARNPQLRIESTPLSTAEGCELKDCVRRFHELEPTFIGTQILELARDRSPVKRSISLMMSFSLCLLMMSPVAVPVRAEAPMIRAQASAKIAIRTLNWAEISINGKKLGYAPISVSGLRPGSHRVSWSSAFGGGEALLELKSGQTLRLSDSDLRVRSKTVNH